MKGNASETPGAADDAEKALLLASGTGKDSGYQTAQDSKRLVLCVPVQVRRCWVLSLLSSVARSFVFFVLCCVLRFGRLDKRI